MVLNVLRYLPDASIHFFDYRNDVLAKGLAAIKNKSVPSLFTLSYLMLLPQRRTNKLLGFDIGPLLVQISSGLVFNSKGQNAVQIMLNLDQRILLSENYNMKADKSTCAASLEERVPLQDYKLVEYLNSMPVNEKMNYLQGKLPLRVIASHRFPKLANRKKHGYGAPMHHWLKTSLSDLLESTIRNKNFRSMLNAHETDKVYGRFLTGNASTNEMLFLWNLLIVFQSLKKYNYIR
jgi:hypothetical protein